MSLTRKQILRALSSKKPVTMADLERPTKPPVEPQPQPEPEPEPESR